MFLSCAIGLCASSAIAQQAPDSVYAPPAFPGETEGINEGAVRFELGVSYFTDYVYRGVEVFEVLGPEDSLNLHIDTKLSFDLGKLPHPYVGVFVNIADDDAVSNFQEIRPTVGFDWTIKPIIVSGGFTSYIYPERDNRETSEVFLQIGLDDKVLVGGNPIPAPYIMAAYDFDLYDGLYLEAGVKYRLLFEDLGLTVTGIGRVAYVSGYASQIKTDTGIGLQPGFFSTALTTDENINGIQHWQVGLETKYSLNKLFNVSTRYGEWSLQGFVYYTDDFDATINATSQIWGGGGLRFEY